MIYIYVCHIGHATIIFVFFSYCDPGQEERQFCFGPELPKDFTDWGQ